VSGERGVNVFLILFFCKDAAFYFFSIEKNKVLKSLKKTFAKSMTEKNKGTAKLVCNSLYLEIEKKFFYLIG